MSGTNVSGKEEKGRDRVREKEREGGNYTTREMGRERGREI